MSRYAQIISTGRFVPEERVTNQALEARVGMSFDQWLIDNTGIKARHYMHADAVTSDMAAAAASAAMTRANIGLDQVDLLIVATDTPDQLSPSTAAVVHHKLGLTGGGTFDINSACSGWVTALDMGAKNIATDPTIKTVVVIGAYAMSRFIDFTDKKTCTLFADGAGAVVLQASDKPGLYPAAFWSDGSYHDAMGIYVGGARHPGTPENLERLGRSRVEFVRRFPPTYNQDHWPKLVRGACAKANTALEDIQLFIFTQLNLRVIEGVMDTLGQSMDKAHWIMDKWGYTGSGCIPMCLDDAVVEGRVKAGDNILFCASGGGISMSACVAKWMG